LRPFNNFFGLISVLYKNILNDFVKYRFIGAVNLDMLFAGIIVTATMKKRPGEHWMLKK